MGAVYEAYDELKQRRCALKLARPTPGVEQAEFSQRFKREAQIGAQLGERIEGVVTAFDFNSLDDGRLFLALDLVEGARDLDLTNGPLSARIERLGRAAAVVAKLHQHGVIHRDLKPANFVQDAEGRVYLTDFGLAKRLGDAEEEPALDGLLTRGGVRMGTPYFMPPEQFRNAGAVDKRADVYALGTMLYLALTGEYPYSVPVAERQAEVWEGMCAPPDPSQIVEALPPALVDVCLKSLELFASKRLASAQEFCTALAPFASPGHSEDPLATGVLHVANEGALSTGQGLDSATRPGLRASPAGREATRQQKRGSPSRPIPQGPADELQLVPLPEDLPRDQPPLPAEEFLHVDSFVTGVTSARDQDEQPADLGLELAAQGSSSFEADSSGAPPQGDPGYCEVCALPLPPTHDSVLCTECQVTEALLEGSTLQDSGAVVIRQAAVHLGVSNPEPASGADPAGLAEPSEALSSRVPCPGCASSLQLPPPGSQTFVQCPTCGSRFRVATQGASEAWTAQPDTAPSELPTFRISGLDRQGLRFHNRKIQARTGMEAIEQAKELGFRLDGYPMKVRPARQKKSATNRKRVEAADERSAATEDQSVPEENFAPAGDGSWALSALVGLPICYVLGLAPFWWIGDLLGFGAKITRDSGVLFFGLWLVILVIAATLVLGAAAPMLLVAGLTLAGLEDRKARSFAAALLGVGLALCVLPFGVNPNSSLIGYFGIQVAVGVGCAGGLGVLAADADSPYTWRRGVLHAGVALALPATLLAGCAAYAALNDWHGSSDVFALVVCVVLLSIGLFGVLLASDLGGMAKLVAALVIVAVVFFIYQFSSAKTYARRKLVYEPIAAAAQARIQPIETHLAKLGVLPEFASLDRSPLHVGILGGGEQTFAVSYEALSGESFRMQVLVKQLADKKFELSYMPETGWAFPDH